MSVLGVDVSSYQSETFSTAGLAFAITKCTEGTGYQNPHYAGQVAHSRAAGLIVGHYHFGRGGNGAAQADYFLSKVTLRAGDFIALDWEDASMTQAERDAFIARIKARVKGHKVILYCNVDFWTHNDSNNGGPMDGLWIADPNHAINHPGIKHGWVIDQYSFAGGIDRDSANFPSVAAFRAWLAPAAPAPAPAPKPVPVPVKPPVIPVHPIPVPTIDQRVATLEGEVKTLSAEVTTLEGKVK